jgi:histone H3/H4
MSHDSSPKSPDAPSASLVDNDRYDELDANIRNFAPVARIMKNALPENAKIAKEAKECMQECVSEFISFITSEGMFGCPLAGSPPAYWAQISDVPKPPRSVTRRRGRLSMERTFSSP